MLDIIGGLLLLVFIVGLPIAGLWKMLEKAGEPAWTAIIPLVNVYKLCKISLGNGLFFLFFFVPLMNLVILFMMCIKLAKAFDKGILFGILMVFFPGISYIILGFGSSEYHRPKPI